MADGNVTAGSTNVSVRVSARYIAALAPFICREETRYYLAGIKVEPDPSGGVLLIATDGHTMGLIRDADGASNGEWIVKPTPGIIRAAAKNNPKTAAERAAFVHFSGNVGSVTNALFSVTDDVTIIGKHHMAVDYAPVIDGTYPDWRKVLKLAPSGVVEAITFDSRKISQFTAAANALGRKIPCVRFVPGANGEPVAVFVDGAPEFVGMLMPMRDFGNGRELPKWVAERPVAEPQSNAA